MNNRQRRTASNFRRILGFVLAHLPNPEPRTLARERARLARIATRLEALATEQYSAHATISTVARQVSGARQHMRAERMIPLVRLVKKSGLKKFSSVPESTLVVPHKRSETLVVAEAAGRLAKALAKHRRLLVDAGHPPTHAADVLREAQALKRDAVAVERARARRARATAEIARLLKEGTRCVGLIDVILAPRLGPVEAKVWQSMKRVPARQGRPLERTRRKRMLQFPVPAAVPEQSAG